MKIALVKELNQNVRMIANISISVNFKQIGEDADWFIYDLLYDFFLSVKH